MRIPCFFLSFAIACVTAMADLIIIVVQTIVNDFHLFLETHHPLSLLLYLLVCPSPMTPYCTTDP
jgi:SNF family Na+-dependent transporter